MVYNEVFLNNKYTRWYYNIIEQAKKRSFGEDVYVERHHILPKSLKGNNSSDNLVKLTAREHFVCHWLLPKMTTGENRKAMIVALFLMRRAKVHKGPNGPKGRNILNENITSRVYAYVREEFSTIMKERVFTDEHRQRISVGNKGKIQSPEARKKIGDFQRGKIISEETKRRMSLGQKGKIVSPEARKKIGDAHRGKKLSEATVAKMRAKTVSPESRERIRKANLGKVLSPEHRQRIAESIKQKMQDPNYKPGRKKKPK